MNRSIQHQITVGAARIARPQFSIEELATLQYWCLKYARFVGGGGTPTAEQDARFLSFQAICYATGVASVEP